ncbi:MAG: hypothetical protein KGN34_03845 [Sphingomonadales bacterium]|nr:hypothetical protein [Sphingomonadales bacterium]
MAEVSTSSPCPGCGAAVYDDAAFCHACGRALHRQAGVMRVVDGALHAAQTGARVVMQNPTAQKVAGGAVLGAGAAILVPFVTMGAGAAIGAAYVGYKLFRKG